MRCVKFVIKYFLALIIKRVLIPKNFNVLDKYNVDIFSLSMQWVIIDDHLYVKGENGLSASIFHTFTFSLVVCRSIIVEQTINIGHSAMKVEQQYSDIPNIYTYVDESRKRK